jgi:2-C-methyl-D-erythritol 4-phosphate cytidylyltransferase
MDTRVVAVIPSAGGGRRFGSSVQKQFLTLAGKPLLVHTLEPFQRSPWIQEILLVVPQEWVDKILDSIVRPYGLTKVKNAVAGGAQRQDSVRLGLEALGPVWDVVVIHDGARPFITQDLIARCVQETLIHGATLLGVPAVDTIKEVDSTGRVQNTLNRERLWMVQTPQSFRYKLALRAHQDARDAAVTGTDDASLVERLGHEVRVLMGSYDNIKVTTPRDLILGEAIIRQRAGQGT